MSPDAPQIPEGLEDTPLAKLAADPKAAAAEIAGEPAKKAGPSIFKKLISPTRKKPQEFDDDLLASAINGAFGMTLGDPERVANARIGESLALCADALLGGGISVGNSPLGHVAASLFHYAKGIEAQPPRRSTSKRPAKKRVAKRAKKGKPALRVQGVVEPEE